MSEPDDLPVAGTAVLLRPATGGIEVLLMRRPDRGSFAGAWVFPGGKVETGDRLDGDGEQDDARHAAVRETREEVGLVIADPVALSLWQPPAQAPVRIRTWFFLSRAPEAALDLSADEVVDAVWTSPERALSRHAAGEWTLFPPTWMTLHGLCGMQTVDEALEAAGTARNFTTRVIETPAGTVFEWDGMRLETRSLPWNLVAG
ncbi:NUDIX domain-containing protein [Microbacterium sp. ANT_H45B]|uniref:NUDIX hydrolase n=1 Tax=Microbacterium sp. ANT_H45B TaxID=2597346 RepID=UPI0011EBC2D1|nr:NUDIX domain-containing protein [Microbacterium sp. ANT_H45B]KAA0961340.1 NUDIX domain-containing protein [Microbacterium sp. ANT_H45B]